MSATAHMPLDTDAYLADTGHLSTIEHGAYLLIMMALWRSKSGWISGEDNYLARAAHMTMGRWKRLAPNVRKLLVTRGKMVSQKRVLRDRNVILSENPNRDANPLINKAPNPESEKSPSKVVGAAESALNLTSLSFLDSQEEKKENKKVSKGRILSDGWQPRAEERLYAKTVLRLSDPDIDAAAEKMRRWAVSNAHRAVARKSDWDLTFRNWLDNDAEKKHSINGNGHANGNGHSNGYNTRGPPRRSSNSAAAAMLELIREEAQNGCDDGQDAFGALPTIDQR